MSSGSIESLKLGDERMVSITQQMHDHYREERGEEIPNEVIAAALEDWLDVHLDRFAEDLPEMLSTPSRAEAAEFRRCVEKLSRPTAVASRETEQLAEVSVFTGNRRFSFEKMAALTTYIAAKGKDVYKTKLNKLLFYSDFVNYYLYGNSISGARYVHLPYGPVPDRYESTLQTLASSGTLQISDQGCYHAAPDEESTSLVTLSEQERSSIDWVLETLGSMTPSEISEFSHQEKAYRFTGQGEFIAYEYAKFFERLPSK